MDRMISVLGHQWIPMTLYPVYQDSHRQTKCQAVRHPPRMGPHLPLPSHRTGFTHKAEGIRLSTVEESNRFPCEILERIATTRSSWTTMLTTAITRPLILLVPVIGTKPTDGPASTTTHRTAKTMSTTALNLVTHIAGLGLFLNAVLAPALNAVLALALNAVLAPALDAVLAPALNTVLAPAPVVILVPVPVRPLVVDLVLATHRPRPRPRPRPHHRHRLDLDLDPAAVIITGGTAVIIVILTGVKTGPR